MNKYLNKDDTSPFYGFGIGWYMNTKISNIYLNTGSGWNPDYWDYELEPRHGVALTAQAGYTLMRTYNTNIIGRIKYHALLMNKPRGGNYHWIDNHMVRATRYEGNFTDLVEKNVKIQVFK